MLDILFTMPNQVNVVDKLGLSGNRAQNCGKGKNIFLDFGGVLCSKDTKFV